MARADAGFDLPAVQIEVLIHRLIENVAARSRPRPSASASSCFFFSGSMRKVTVAFSKEVLRLPPP